MKHTLCLHHHLKLVYQTDTDPVPDIWYRTCRPGCGTAPIDLETYTSLVGKTEELAAKVISRQADDWVDMVRELSLIHI